MGEDWTGNSGSVYGTLGASNHSEKEREENDYYATSPKAVAYAWFVWEKGYNGDPIIKWINTK